MPGIELGAIGLEARMLPLCHAAPLSYPELGRVVIGCICFLLSGRKWLSRADFFKVPILVTKKKIVLENNHPRRKEETVEWKSVIVSANQKTEFLISRIPGKQNPGRALVACFWIISQFHKASWLAKNLSQRQRLMKKFSYCWSPCWGHIRLLQLNPGD